MIKSKIEKSENLCRHAGFYLQHVTYELDRYAKLVIILENINGIVHVANYNLISDKIEIETDPLGLPGLIRLIDDSEQKIRVIDSGSDGDMLFIDNGQFDSIYRISSGGKLKYGAGKAIEFVTDESEIEYIDEIVDRIIRPILEIQLEPEVNLQDSFNERYEGRFD